VSVFMAEEAYVYRIPPATTVGHRAETWNVNSWLQEVRAVEPVIDSSRYFVLKIVDRDSGRHAFIGLGFREREKASDFNATLHEHMQYVRRKHTAAGLRTQYEEQLAANLAMAAPDSLPQATDFSIPEGQNLVLKVPAAHLNGGCSTPKSGFISSNRGRLSKTFSLLMDGEGNVIAGMSPRTTVDEMGLSPSSSTSSALPDGEGSIFLGLPRLSGAAPVHRDEWGDFVA
ncbi:hypothetical protein APUTEX25_002304, partial [Auxenochlorella protothecoides]